MPLIARLRCYAQDAVRVPQSSVYADVYAHGARYAFSRDVRATMPPAHDVRIAKAGGEQRAAVMRAERLPMRHTTRRYVCREVMRARKQAAQIMRAA